MQGFIKLPASAGLAKIAQFIRNIAGDDCNVQQVVNVNPLDTGAGALTLVNDTLIVDVTDAAMSIVTISGIYNSANVKFECSDDGGTTYFAQSAMRSDSNTVETTSGAITNLSRAWKVSCNGYNKLKVTLTAITSGSAAVRITPSPFGTEPIPAVPSHAVTLSAGSAIYGDGGIAVRTSATNANSRLKVISAATVNATSVKASAGRVYGYRFVNKNAATVYLKLYNKASAPTVGTDTPVDTIPLPPGISQDFNIIGDPFSTGIAMAITLNPADSDNTAIAANDVIGRLLYA